MKNVVIIGGSSGLGLALTQRFLDKNHHVFATWHTQPEALHALLKDHPNLTCTKFDLLDAPLPNLPMESIDVLIFNAAVIHSQLLIKETLDRFQSIIHSNLTSVHLLIKQLFRPLSRSTNPHIILVSSFSGVHGNAGQVAYSAAKSGLLGLGKSLAREFANRNIKINMILPGFMPGPQTDHLQHETVEDYRSANVLQRFNTLAEISRSIEFITTTENISGQVFNLDSRIQPQP